MIKESNIAGFAGVNNAQSSYKLRFPGAGRKAGLVEGNRIDNAYVTNNMTLKRRQGYTLAYTGVITSLWSHPTTHETFFIEGTSLKKLVISGASVNAYVVRVLDNSDLKMSYTAINYITVCSNGVDLFFVENGVAYDFAASSRRFKEIISSGQKSFFYNGRLYIASDTQLFFTDPWDFQALDVRDDPFVFNKAIAFCAPLGEGFFVGADRVFWISGNDPSEASSREVCEGIPIAGSDVVFDGTLIGVSGNAIVFSTNKGVFIGDGTGQVKPVTIGIISMPTGTISASFVRQGSDVDQYIAVISN